MTSIPRGDLPLYVATPATPGPWPGVVVIHDALGMSNDLRVQADWLADAGYLAVAPDLFRGRNKALCVMSVMCDVRSGQGETFDDIETVRAWLATREDCTGRIAVMGFYLGGGIALVLSSGCGFDAASVNYGVAHRGAYSEAFLRDACPIVASFGAEDWTLIGAADRLEEALTAAGVTHDVKQYAGAGHGFMNDHVGVNDVLPPFLGLMSRLAAMEFGYIEDAALDARQRIIAFFDAQLRS